MGQGTGVPIIVALRLITTVAAVVSPITHPGSGHTLFAIDATERVSGTWWTIFFIRTIGTISCSLS